MLVITWIDLIGIIFSLMYHVCGGMIYESVSANLGGILNLTLGISVISICELFYCFGYKLFKSQIKRSVKTKL